MSLKIGIVGLPNVGKSSLFNALTKNDALVANYPFATIEPNIGNVKLLDQRIQILTDIAKPNKVTHATIEFVDIAGLVKGASSGEGLGNKFLDNIRTVSLICLVVRCFENKEIIHVNSKIDPVSDAQTIMWELIYSDIERLTNVQKKMKSNDPMIKTIEKIIKHLEKGLFISTLDLDEKETFNIKGYQLLTTKNMFFLANIDDQKKSLNYLKEVEDFASSIGSQVLKANINVELEISKLPEEEQKEYLETIGERESSLSRIVCFAFRKLGLNHFFTVGKEEVKSWTYKDGWTIQECAGLIHTDLKDGFIKAKVVKYDDFVNCPDWNELQNQGKVQILGKNYITEDADIVRIEFKK